MTETKGTARIEKWYRKIGTISVGAVLFLILVGGIVRSTGSGMGCPDWPKCFGLWVPPTEVGQIPATFFEQHPEYSSQTFNVAQTWTEYINRLVGALIGLFMFATAVLSLGYIKKDRRIFLLSTAGLLLTGFEGWLGKLVVDKNLAGGMVTTHMFVAILIVMVVISAVYLSYTRKPGFTSPQGISFGNNLLGFAVIVLTIGQILIGTQVREGVDEVGAAMGFAGRETWLSQSGFFFSIHKIFWAVVAAGIVVWLKNLFAVAKGNKFVRWMGIIILVTLALEVVLGISLTAFDLPPTLQPAHLLIANLMFGAQFSLLIYCARLERFAKPKMSSGNFQAAHIDS